MTARLIKASALAMTGAVRRLGAVADEAAAPPERSALDEECDRLRGEVARLNAEAAARETRWQTDLDAQSELALAAAREAHRDDDARRIERLETALADASERFGTTMIGAGEALGVALAQRALARLIGDQAGRADWLAAHVAERVRGLTAEAVIAVQLAPDDFAGGDHAAALAERLPPGQRIEPDPAVPAGQARILLRLGRIDVDPDAGAQAMLAALDGGHGAGAGV